MTALKQDISTANNNIGCADNNVHKSLFTYLAETYIDANPAQKITLFCVLLSLLLMGFSYLYNSVSTHYFTEPKSYLHSIAALAFFAAIAVFVGYYKTLFPTSRKPILLTCVFLCVFVVMSLAAILRLTPLPPIDNYLFHFDQLIGLDQNQIINAFFQHKYLVIFFGLAYASLTIQLIILPVSLFIFFKQEHCERFIAYFALVNFIGLVIYYFFPTASPASILDHKYLVDGQINLALEFKQIHQGITPTVVGAGLISFPSFHIIWATLLTYTFRKTKRVFYPLLVINTLLTASTFLLGWHYFVDILGGWAVVAFAIWFVDKQYSFRK
ncbi:phosphatase PAP2 family protein [Vibrio sp. S4M6]|uniref:phosphatase PAP2 family protein n=1 Tax=Vibrio sinus TaxID=2946865 RepID=UPI00202A9DA1|nr:phosphatase PAP2 family protein [Vibrio sinus]MCL9780804.1 phosphatase PAP2 family protein [Vibrio sinus]